MASGLAEWASVFKIALRPISRRGFGNCPSEQLNFESVTKCKKSLYDYNHE